MKMIKFHLICVSFVGFVFSGIPVFADRPSADLTGDCFVDREDSAVVANQWLTTEWIHQYSEQDWTDGDPRLIRTDKNGYYVVGNSTYSSPERGFESRLWIWRLDSKGQRLWTKPVNVKGGKFVCGDLISLDNERVFIVRESPRGTGTWLIRFDEDGKTSFQKKLELGEHPYWLSSMMKIRDGYLVAGYKRYKIRATDAWVMKLDFDGNILWQKTYDKGKSEAAISMVVTENGGFVIAANTGTYDKFGGGPSSIWVFRCDPAGKIIAETTFEGRRPTIAMTKGGICAVAYNTADVPALEQYVKGLNKDLQEIWKPQLLYKGDGIGLYPIKIDNNDNFIIAGPRHTSPESAALWLWKFSKKGKLLWEEPVNNTYFMVMVESFLLDGDEFLLTGTTHRKSPMPRDKEGNRIKDQQWDITDILVVKVRESEMNK